MKAIARNHSKIKKDFRCLDILLKVNITLKSFEMMPNVESLRFTSDHIINSLIKISRIA